MKLSRLAIPGAYVTAPDAHEDERGSFQRTFCAAEFEAMGLASRVAQSSIAGNTHVGTLRGLHFTTPPSGEVKLVRCVRGRMFDVLVDLREDQPTFRAWISMELSADNGRSVLIPPGVAHGYLTLEDRTDVLYQMSEPYDPDLARGVRYDDPSLAVAWPFMPRVICDRDRSYPDMIPAAPSTPRPRALSVAGAPGAPRRPGWPLLASRPRYSGG